MGPPARADGMRGTGLLALLGIELGRAGVDDLRARLRSLPEPVLAKMNLDTTGFGVDPDAWYPPPFVHSIVDATLGGLPEATAGELVKDAARVAVGAAMKTRPTFAMLDSPERVSRLLNAVWRSAFSDGTFSVLTAGPHKVTLRRGGWSGHHRLICRFGMEAGAVLYELASGKHAKMTMQSCISDDKPDCSALIEW